MLLPSMALADDVVAHLGVSTGIQAIPALGWVAHPNGFVRFEVGAGPERVQGYFVAQLGLFNGLPWYSQTAYGAPVVIIGDVLFTEVGVGARIPIDIWVLRMIPHLDLGLATGSSPIEPSAYEEDVLPELDNEPSVGRHASGVWAQAGAEVGYPVLEDAVDVHVGVDVGYIAIRGVGLTMDARVGLAARF